MIVNIRDPQTLRQINPTSVSTYLQQNGWQKQHVKGTVAFWTKIIDDNEQVEISLPLDPKLADFHFRISEVLQTLAIVEHRVPEEIFNDFVNIITQRTEANIHICAKNNEFTGKIIITILRWSILARPSYKISITIAAFSTIIIMGLILVLQSADIPRGLIVCLLVGFSMLAFLSISLGTTDSIIDLEEDEI